MQHLGTPSQTLLMHIRPVLLFGMQYFFLKVSFRRASALDMVAGLTFTGS
jgi:hypothetical protein